MAVCAAIGVVVVSSLCWMYKKRKGQAELRWPSASVTRLMLHVEQGKARQKQAYEKQGRGPSARHASLLHLDAATTMTDRPDVHGFVSGSVRKGSFPCLTYLTQDGGAQAALTRGRCVRSTDKPEVHRQHRQGGGACAAPTSRRRTGSTGRGWCMRSTDKPEAHRQHRQELSAARAAQTPPRDVIHMLAPRNCCTCGGDHEVCRLHDAVKLMRSRLEALS
eukprot:302059-Chlamydomonas_euryale.AAC.2